MPSGFTTTFINKALDHFLLGTIYAQPAGLWIGLCTVDPGASATLGTVVEPTDAAYARVKIMGTPTWLSAASGGVKTNSNDIAFPTALIAWGTITHYFITDGTSVIWTGQFLTPRAVIAGDVATVKSGKLALTLARSTSPVGGFTTAFKNKILDHMFMGTVYTQPAGLKLGLCTGDPGVGATTLPATNELATANGYAEQSIAFAAASTGSKGNNSSPVFGPNTTTNWGTLTYWIVTDATNVIGMAILDNARAIVVGDSVTLAAAAIAFSLNRS